MRISAMNQTTPPRKPITYQTFLFACVAMGTSYFVLTGLWEHAVNRTALGLVTACVASWGVVTLLALAARQLVRWRTPVA
ncbi:MAG: hypothetical protein ACI8QC_001337 [Planctomycetota bacterium]|jgi:hypothetical protein